MKILFFSDLHLAEWEDFSYLLPNGDNSRLTDLLDILTRISVLYQKHECDAVVFAGDLFHHSRSIMTRVYQKAYAALEKVAANVAHLIILAGNHDMALFQNQQATSIYPLKNLPNTTIILNATYLVLDRKVGYGRRDQEVLLHALPFMEGTNKIKTALADIKAANGLRSVLVSHCGLTEAVIGPNEIKIEAPLSLKDLQPLKLDCALFGHYHKPQDFSGNTHIIGATAQHNMLDRGEKRGVLIYDSDTNETKRVWLKGPQFHLFELANKNDLDGLKWKLPNLKDSYVRVLLKTKSIIKDQIVELLENAAVRAHQVRYAVQQNAEVRNQALTTKLLGSGLEDCMCDYVDHVAVDGLDKPKLIETGKTLLKEYETNL